jgi:thiol-disulfide isomerase/thioredoxin
MLRAVVLMTLLISLSPPDPSQADVPAPQVTLKDINGRTTRLSDYKGKVVLLNFWATWCVPCLKEMPDLIKWQQQYKGRGLQVIGITYPPEELAEVRKFTKSMKVNYPVVMGDEATKAKFDDGDVLPITVVIDRNGAIRGVIRGIIFPEEFDEKVKPLLR